MINKPIFILSDSYQKYSNYINKPESNSQSVAFINETGKEGIILGSDLGHVRFNFVPSAPRTTNDLILKSNNGILSWVAFPTSGGTTTINEGIKPPFNLNSEEYNNLSWAYYIRGDYDNTGLKVAQGNAPIGTIFSNFNYNLEDFNLDDGLSVRVPANWGYKNDLAHVVLELDGNMVAIKSDGMIEDCSVLRFFVTNEHNNGRVPRRIIGELPYMSYSAGDGYVYLNIQDNRDITRNITKIVTDKVLDTAIKPVFDETSALSTELGALATKVSKISKTPDNPIFTRGASIIKVYVTLSKISKGSLGPLLINRGSIIDGGTMKRLSNFEVYCFSTIRLNRFSSFTKKDTSYIYNLAPISKIIEDPNLSKTSDFDISVITELYIGDKNRLSAEDSFNFLKIQNSSIYEYLSLSGINAYFTLGDGLPTQIITNEEHTKLQFTTMVNKDQKPYGMKVIQESDTNITKFINPLALFNVDGSSKLIPIFTNEGVRYLMFEIKNMPDPVIPIAL